MSAFSCHKSQDIKVGFWEIKITTSMMMIKRHF